MSVLSDKRIIELKDEGLIVIEPFKRSNLATSSYDVTLGKFFYREKEPEPGRSIYNPYSKQMVERVWGDVCEAKPVKEHDDLKLENVSPDDLVIFIRPGETILGHTNEFIGGRKNITTMMKARSSLGRNFIEVCKCAGWGDVGYTMRWTMEITNNSRFYSIPLVVGRRVAQIIFFETTPLADDNKCYIETSGKYQTTRNQQELQEQWSPQQMLPKMYLDREITQKKSD